MKKWRDLRCYICVKTLLHSHGDYATISLSDTPLLVEFDILSISFIVRECGTAFVSFKFLFLDVDTLLGSTTFNDRLLLTREGTANAIFLISR